MAQQLFDESIFDAAIFDCNTDGVNDLDARNRRRGGSWKDWRMQKSPGRTVYDRVR